MEKEILKCIKNNKVNWNEVYKIYEKYPRSSDEIYKQLKLLGFLTPHAKGNFGLTCGVSCNPSCVGIPYYFMTQEDAEAYRIAFYRDACYRVQLIQFIS